MKSNLKLENANKAAFLVKSFPDKTIEELLELWVVPPIQSNAGFWMAQELGWISDVVDGKCSFIENTEAWQFGDVTDNLIDQLQYCFAHLSRDETDLEEKWLTDWLTGYPPHEVLIAMHYLEDERILGNYEIVDHNAKLGDSTYKFYTLFENIEQQWGRKQFKVDPGSEAVDEIDDTPEEDKHLGEA